ncbi:hypothetical protein G7Y89_g5126 [Cudoniella acicularis]|uniref:Glyoxalase-like domain-containing protein n=1 Tax=Cudoniella acicularis TaxID=354080 RepID=A0A8H4RQA8_9HELO|nr:hypothetical protein G7Y89_g5126 [Cudoniella acicularis]
MPSTPTRLRQIALVATDLEKATKLLTTIIGTEVIYRDPAVEHWGLKNALLPIGGDFIEVVSPFKPNTTGSRLLAKRGDGGYMVIMQTVNANAQRKYLEGNGLAKVIFMHETEGSVCVQYHPKGIKGGMIPELDSHHPYPSNPTPLESPFSPWHALGPSSNHSIHGKAMMKYSHLHLLSITCRLAPGVADIAGAARQWEELFDVRSAAHEGQLQFTNARLRFLPGKENEKEGLLEVCVGVEGTDQLNDILDRAEKEGLVKKDGLVDMVGVLWKFVPFVPLDGEVMRHQARLPETNFKNPPNKPG